jgi:hypothetical protein
MKGKILAAILLLGLIALLLSACGGERPIDVAAVTAQPKTFVGSNTCKMCHLEHYDSWKMTQHSRMIQDARENQDVIVTQIDEKIIRTDLAKLGDKLKVPADQIYVPKLDEILYTIGSQWKQRFIVKKDDTLFISPIQYNVETHRWVNYHEADWDKRPWLLKCGGCHTTGVDMDKQTFKEPGVACEACHGKGSWHAALPKTAVFEKRQTIVNPSKLTMGVAQQICGSCHNRGKSTKMKGAGWAVGYEPGKSLEEYYRSTSYAGGDKKHGPPSATHRLVEIPACQGRGHLHLLPLRAPDRDTTDALPDPRGRFQTVRRMPRKNQQHWSAFHPCLWQLCGLPHA